MASIFSKFTQVISSVFGSGVEPKEAARIVVKLMLFQSVQNSINDIAESEMNFITQWGAENGLSLDDIKTIQSELGGDIEDEEESTIAVANHMKALFSTIKKLLNSGQKMTLVDAMADVAVADGEVTDFERGVFLKVVAELGVNKKAALTVLKTKKENIPWNILTLQQAGTCYRTVLTEDEIMAEIGSLPDIDAMEADQDDALDIMSDYAMAHLEQKARDLIGEFSNMLSPKYDPSRVQFIFDTGKFSTDPESEGRLRYFKGGNVEAINAHSALYGDGDDDEELDYAGTPTVESLGEWHSIVVDPAFPAEGNYCMAIEEYERRGPSDYTWLILPKEAPLDMSAVTVVTAKPCDVADRWNNLLAFKLRYHGEELLEGTVFKGYPEAIGYRFTLYKKSDESWTEIGYADYEVEL